MSESFKTIHSKFRYIRLALTIACVVVPAFEDVASAQDIEIRALSHTSETDDDLKRLHEALNSIPEPIRRDIAGAGIHVDLTPVMTYDMPERSGKHMFRGGGTTENIGGEFEPNRNRVVVPERSSWRNGAPRSQGKGMMGIARHELGHAWYQARKFASNRSYLDAYEQDVQKLSNTQMTKFQYGITGTATSAANVPTGSGRSECFACVFNMLCEPSQAMRLDPNGWAVAFPHVVAWMQSVEPGLKKDPEVVRKPDRRQERQQEQREADDRDVAKSSNEAQSAMNLINQRRFDDAIAVLCAAIKRDPSNDRAYLLRGEAYSWLKKYKPAVNDLTTYIKKHPDDIQAHKLRADAYGWLGQARSQKYDEWRIKQLQKQTGN
jgi:hypothetical protein